MAAPLTPWDKVWIQGKTYTSLSSVLAFPKRKRFPDPLVDAGRIFIRDHTHDEQRAIRISLSKGGLTTVARGTGKLTSRPATTYS